MERMVSMIEIGKIVPNPYQPRHVFDQEALQELAASIACHGVLQPITVRRVGGLFELIAGERRLRAAYMAGLKQIPSIIMEMSDEQSAVVALIENIQRKDLSYLEEAAGYQRLAEEYHMTQEEIAHLMGKTQSAVANKLRILRLSEGVKQVLTEYGLTERHARALLRLPAGERQLDAALYMGRMNLTVRQAEAYVETLLQSDAVLLEGKTARETGLASSLAGSGSKKGRPRVRRYIRDIRLFTNTVKKAASYMTDAGVPVEIKENQNERYYEMVVRVPYDLGR